MTKQVEVPQVWTVTKVVDSFASRGRDETEPRQKLAKTTMTIEVQTTTTRFGEIAPPPDFPAYLKPGAVLELRP